MQFRKRLPVDRGCPHDFDTETLAAACRTAAVASAHADLLNAAAARLLAQASWIDGAKVDLDGYDEARAEVERSMQEVERLHNAVRDIDAAYLVARAQDRADGGYRDGYCDGLEHAERIMRGNAAGTRFRLGPIQPGADEDGFGGDAPEPYTGPRLVADEPQHLVTAEWLEEVTAERDEARAESQRATAWHMEALDDLAACVAERDDWRRRYEALRDGVTGLTEDEWGSRADETERCPLCRRKWSKHTDYDGRCYDGASTLAGYIRDLRAVVARVEES